MKSHSIAIPLLILAAVSLTGAQQTNISAATNQASPAEPESPETVSRTDQERIQLLHTVASVYYQDKDYTSAVDAYERILEIDPQNKEALFIIAPVYISAKQYGRAEEILKTLLHEHPDDFQIMNNLAWLYATAENPAYRDGERAIQLAQEAISIAPNDHHLWSTLSEAYYVTGQYEKAYRAITHMASLAMRFGAGITQEMVNSYNEQIVKCRRAMESEQALRGEEPSEDE